MIFCIEELRKNIEKFKVAVIGDYCLDQYWYMDSKADKKLDYNDDITFALTKIAYYPGGAGNVANNFAKLGANVKCVGIVGDDGFGYQLIKCLKEINTDIEKMIRSTEKETHTCTRPIRIIEGNNIKLNEIITYKSNYTSKTIEEKVINILKNIIAEVDAFILVEQFDENNKGIFTDKVREEIISLSKRHKDKIFIVDSRKYIDKYKNIYLKCNQNEFFGTMSRNIPNETRFSELVKYLEEFKGCFITRGEMGMTVIDIDGKINNVAAIKTEKVNNTLTFQTFYVIIKNIEYT